MPALIVEREVVGPVLLGELGPLEGRGGREAEEVADHDWRQLGDGGDHCRVACRTGGEIVVPQPFDEVAGAQGATCVSTREKVIGFGGRAGLEHRAGLRAGYVGLDEPGQRRRQQYRVAIDGEEGAGVVQLELGGGDLFDARDGECVEADQGSHDAEFSGHSLVCEASPQLLLVLVVRLEVRRESLAGELCIERSGQFSLREPSDEGVDGLPSGGVLREPQIQILLVQVREGELVLVEPVQQADCGSDVATVGPLSVSLG